MARKPVEIKAIRGKRLKALLEEQGIKQAELSQKIHLSQQTISKIINGGANLTEDTARAIIYAFPGYSYDYLMGFDQEPNLYESPLDFEKDWIRRGGGAHPLTNPTVVEARLAVAIEQMNKDGWIVAVDMVESLLKIPAFKKNGKEGGNDNEV